jgi:hypothetical protein
MVTSVHLARVALSDTLAILRRPPRTADVPGLRYAETTMLAPLSARLLPAPTLTSVGLIAAWDDDRALDAFLDEDPIAAALNSGFRVRLRPTRAVGSWPQLPDLPRERQPQEQGPVAALTLGHLRPSRAVAFLRASARAEADALAGGDMVLATGLARPPHLVATFSIWRDLEAMRGYVDHATGGHRNATTTHAAKSFHKHSAFIRFEPYDQHGTWDTPRPSQARPTRPARRSLL